MASPPLKRAKLPDENKANDHHTATQEITNLTPIESLPCELLWTIIEYVPGAVFNLRLVSYYGLSLLLVHP